MRERNMWISEPGRERSAGNQLPPDQIIGKTALDAVDDLPAAPEATETMSTEPNTTNALAGSGLSLDELVARSWKKW